MFENKQNTAMTGGYAVGEALRQIDPDVMAVYPITPQTPIIEYFAKKRAGGQIQTEIITVESEHSAMSACIGAAAAGARTATASSSQGILYMFEALPIASAMRLPILMAVATRAVSGPINIHGDHSDAMLMRETGWLQLFTETVQEAYDHVFIGLKMAEKAGLPMAVNMDGFVTSHSVENISLIPDNQARIFLGKYKPKETLLNFENPVTFGPLALQNSYFEFRKQIWDAFNDSFDFFYQSVNEFEKMFGRKYDVIEEYQTQDAEKVIVALGATCGTIKEVVDKMRKNGEKVGLIKIRLFRPFPYDAIKKALEKTKEVIALDKHLPFGNRPILAGEIENAIGRGVKSVVYGLGGREVLEKDIEDIFKGKIKDFLF